jgi:hypothetical protein
MDQYHFFYETKSPFSQWHPCKFTDGKTTFTSSEQYMMYQKALMFRDIHAAADILATNNCRTIKAIGRQIHGFNQAAWDGACVGIVVQGNIFKFSQNPKLCEALLATGDKTLVEASPTDKIWGIGLNEAIAKKTPPDQWPGKNLLGRCLMTARTVIKTSQSQQSLLR